MRIGFVTFLGALLAVVPCAALAITATPVAQAGAPVQIESCSAQTVDYTKTPIGGRWVQGPQFDSTGHISSLDQQWVYQGPTAPMYAGTHLFSWAQSVNSSGKTVSGIVYQFNVMSQGKPISSFYGPRSGTFDQNARITPYGTGTVSPWQTNLTQPKLDAVNCFVAFVRFSDGTSWLSPLATIPPGH